MKPSGKSVEKRAVLIETWWSAVKKNDGPAESAAYRTMMPKLSQGQRNRLRAAANAAGPGADLPKIVVALGPVVAEMLKELRDWVSSH